MDSMKRYFLFALSILFVLCLTGCWGNREIEDLSVNVGLALDVGEESELEQELAKEGDSYPKKNLITATLQTVPVLKGKSEKQSGSSKSSPMYLNTEETGDSIFQLYRQFSLRRYRPIIGHHLKVIVISSELSRKMDLNKLLKFISRDNDIRPSCLILISKEKASEALISSQSGDIPSFHLRSMVENQFRNNKILAPMILTKLDGIMNSGSSFILQNLVSAKGEVEFAGAGVIKGKINKWIGTLNEHEVEGLNWIRGEIEGGVIKTYDKSGEVLAYEIKSAKTKIKTKVQGNDISFHVSIESDGRLIENWDTSQVPTDDKFLKEAEGYFEEELKEMLHKTIHKIQEVYHVDVGGFNNKLRIQHPKVWKKVKKEWDETFSQSDITYDVKLNITDYGSSTK
ncbi:Ger(x)C family spore germination protein [Paenibacillus glacialis]|uniref:Spore gernimation protein GerC n=1 Tax=Paenibacillus glacialis TaxID=494026 RepID=A0A168K3S4_9BACL|nr:Ger(x)C family spore germination protein [Paenibacillus glacialis]OAB41499.1 spore gernimation protein GerC [Paenibacillus glacialis]